MKLFKIREIYDLSWGIYPTMPVWPGNKPPQFEKYETHEVEGCIATRYSFNAHFSTHLDAPYHYLKNGKKLEDLTLEDLSGYALFVDVSDKYGPDEGTKDVGVTLEDLKAAISSTHEKLNPGDMILINTGWHRIWTSKSEDYFRNHPWISVEAGRWLAKMKVKLVGIDTCDVDTNRAYEIHPYNPENHIINFLPNNILILENVGGQLSEVCGRRMFTIVAPIKMIGGEAAPARVLALDISS
jgi:arylformamidase